VGYFNTALSQFTVQSVGERIFKDQSAFGKVTGKYILVPFPGHSLVPRHSNNFHLSSLKCQGI